MNLMPDQQHSQFLLHGQGRFADESCRSDEGVPEHRHYFYRLRLNLFIQAAKGQNPANLDAIEIAGILEGFGRDGSLTAYHFSEMVDAVRILLTNYLSCPAALQVDWAYWKSSARGIAGDHATTARQHSPKDLVFLKINRRDNEYSEIRMQHRDLIVRFVTEIRARGYAYRTEEAYEQWIVRYISFCRGESPEDTGANHVSKYLNDLVVNGNVSASTQNQALNALIFLYKQVLRVPIGDLDNYSNPAMTSARCRSCWDIPMLPPP